MNKTRYLQTDSRWSQLPFRNLPDNIGNNGCGMVSICNAIIEMKKYANYTPATMQPYCRQFVVPAGYIIADIPVTMKHYGLTDVKEHATMDSLWKELAKGGRVAVYLMGNRPGGSKKVHWTSGGHFVSSVAYQYKDGDHWVYMKDSASNSSLRNGWMSYKENLRGDVSRVWSGKLSDAPAPSPSPDPKPTPSGKLVVDGIGGTATVRRMQEFFGTTVDGVISGQMKQYKSYYPSIHAIEFGKGGSAVVTALQKWLGLSGPYGIIGPNTTKAWQRKLRSLGYLASNETIDGIFGVKSMSAWQECLNSNGKKKGGTPTPDPKPTPGKETKVIDVSEFQDSINWNKVKATGIDGAIIRCGFRGATTAKLQEDAMFINHIKGAHKAGVKCGIYMFTEAINDKEGREEADYAIAQWKKAGVPLYYPIAVDTEKVNIKGERARNLTKAQRTSAIKGFCERIKELGYTPMIYASTDWLNNKLDMSKLPYDVWVAQYYKECQYKGKYVMWQYTSTGKVAGISGNVDLNHCYIDLKEVNPPSDPKPTPPTPTPDKQGYPGEYPNTNVKIEKREAIARKANELAYSTNTSSAKYPSGKPTSAYKTDLDSLPKSKHNWNAQARAGASCDVFVWTVLQKAGVDGSYPSGLWKQYNYMEKNYQQIKASEAKAGDIGFYRKDVKGQRGHIFICYSDNKTKEASYNSYYPKTIKDLKSRLSIKGKKYVKVYRPKGFITRNYLMKGDKGEEIKKLQQYMNWYDTSNKLAVDGDYGNATFKAVHNFQEKEMGKGQGDGTVGPKTIEAMKKVKK